PGTAARRGEREPRPGSARKDGRGGLHLPRRPPTRSYSGLSRIDRGRRLRTRSARGAERGGARARRAPHSRSGGGSLDGGPSGAGAVVVRAGAPPLRAVSVRAAIFGAGTGDPSGAGRPRARRVASRVSGCP